MRAEGTGSGMFGGASHERADFRGADSPVTSQRKVAMTKQTPWVLLGITPQVSPRPFIHRAGSL